jgi:Rps23 Pro-64 3,4-dihydroxylase Tpa1-like proline 4-hydroxylase
MSESAAKKSKLEEAPEAAITPAQAGKLLNANYLTNELVETIRDDYKSHKPFNYTVLPSFMDESFLKEVAKELESEEWFPKNNDLYTFLQTDDLKISEKPNLHKMKEVIYSPEFRSFLQGVTGIELNSVVDISASKYWSGCQLLCHDDELEGRRIAFIFYLVPDDWSEEDGGTLDLFDVDAAGQPRTVTESILPAWNNFLFFEVTPTSFHQVAEVLSSKQRLSISGWFHGAPIVRPPPYVEEPLPRATIATNASVDLTQWIHPNYLNPKYQAQINQQFSEQSSIELPNFLTDEKWEALSRVFDRSLEAETMGTETSATEPSNGASSSSATADDKDAMNADDVPVTKADLLPFELVGPANRRNYETLGRWKPIAGVHPLVEEGITLFRSPEFSSLLEKLTGLTLAQVHSEVRRFRQGAYTLAQDNQDQHSERGLDGYYFLCPIDAWDVDVGGQITYMDEEDELATMIPSDNSFSLVFRDVGCMKYVKYVNHEAPSVRQEFSLIFWEDPASIN